MQQRPSSRFTLGNTVYLDPSAYDETSVSGLSLIGHELQHVQQYQDAGGIIGMGASYIGTYLGNRLDGMDHYGAYRAINVEDEARATAREISGQLDHFFGGDVCGNSCD